MTERPTDVNVAHLPSTVFGPGSLPWWGTIGFIVIEGFTIVLAVATYFYLAMNQYDWPPASTPLPDLTAPTANLLLLLFLIVPMRKVDHAARAFDRAGVLKWLAVVTVLTIPALVLRWFELDALNVRWDSNAYASAAWAIVILHGTLLLFDFLETGAFAILFYLGHAQEKHFSDASDVALYQYYLSLTWVPLYLVVYWGPRLL